MRNRPLHFVLLIGIMSFFADFVYEGARSVTGPYLAVLGASATLVGLIAGLGEMLGYGLRLVSGVVSERTREFWPITIFGYLVQMTAVPLLAVATTWQGAAVLIVLERVGRAIRNPPRDVMLSNAGKQVGLGWTFGLHEALDQLGAFSGPLVLAWILARHSGYRLGFAVLAIPAAITIAILVFARIAYPRPEEMEVRVPDVHGAGLPRTFWVYVAGAAFVAAGFADFSLMAYHFQVSKVVPQVWIPIFYAIAMAVSGLGSLGFGKLFDRSGLWILIPLTLLGAASTPLAFLGHQWAALVGCAVWGLGMGVHESIIPAAVATMVPQQRRPSAYGTFTAAYGVSWFLGSVVIGKLYDISLPALIGFSVAAQLAAIPIFLAVIHRMPTLERDSASS
ncbi:MAG TPA: MFS transporter [Terriglobales bacterium]|jgi:predicted MFS family arabinose efflux permease|nr:MFS transporter [Terriglobales bacterium]